jgi:hypothetical protein
MTQIRCADCHRSIPDEAKTCPACGSHTPHGTAQSAGHRAADVRWWLAFVFLLAIPLLVLGGVSFPLVVATAILCGLLAVVSLPFIAIHHHRHHGHHHH